MDILNKITQAIEPSLTSMGYRVVQMKLAEGSRRRALIITAERIDEKSMGFDDCTEISRIVSALLDVEDPISGAYDLEVCSPGIDRPLTRPEDYTRFAGQEAKVESMFPIEGRKRFKGVIEGIEKEVITLETPEGIAKIPYGQIRAAKLTGMIAVPQKPKKKNKK